MPINKAMLAALNLLSYPDLNIEKIYPVERKLQKLTARRARKPWLYRIWEHRIPSGEYQVPMRIFTPKQQKRPCVLLFFHGGGWVTGSIDSYDGICGDMAAQTGGAWPLWTTGWPQSIPSRQQQRTAMQLPGRSFCTAAC